MHSFFMTLIQHYLQYVLTSSISHPDDFFFFKITIHVLKISKTSFQQQDHNSLDKILNGE